MIFPDFATFCQLATGGNFVPLYQEWVADLETPVSAWYKVCAGQPYSFLLESIEGGERIGRYSFLGADPAWVLEVRGDRLRQTNRHGHVQEYQGNPLEILSECLAPYKPVKLPQLPVGIGGLFGFWGYELVKFCEPKVPIYPAGDDDPPDGLWMQVDKIIIFDQVKRKIWAIAYADLRDPDTDLQQIYQQTKSRIELELVGKLQQALPKQATVLAWQPGQNGELNYTSNTSADQYCAQVEKAKEYIRAGDIFQVVISQKLSANYRGEPFDLYRSLRLVNPSPYMAYFQLGNWQIIGSSPEVMVKTERNPDTGNLVAILRPIAGTRPRGATPAEDLRWEQELLADPKEIAEHIMLVDLGRNDLGRVCTGGSIAVDELMVIERYSHVMHIVSNITGELAAQKDAWDLLRSCFPAGTVSGAPKIRAMQIIHELEPERRGVYSGIYGYYDFEGQLNTAIAIRTMVVRPQGDGTHLVCVQAGAGLVADSNPHKEYIETLNKAKGLLEAMRCLAVVASTD